LYPKGKGPTNLILVLKINSITLFFANEQQSQHIRQSSKTISDLKVFARICATY
jgi:hypothetical protein